MPKIGEGGASTPDWVMRAKVAGYTGAGYTPREQPLTDVERRRQEWLRRIGESRAATAERTTLARAGELPPRLDLGTELPLGEVFGPSLIQQPSPPPIKGTPKSGDLAPQAPYGTWTSQWGRIAAAAGLAHASLGVTYPDWIKFKLAEYYASGEAPPAGYTGAGGGYYRPRYRSGGLGGRGGDVGAWVGNMLRWVI